MEHFDQAYWDTRYANNETGWDIGQPSTPLKTYIDQLPNKNCHILIPGGGNSYEAAYLLSLGFTNVTIVDISSIICQKLQHDYATYLQTDVLKVLNEDFFTHNGTYDLIVEQTFFCALNPALRPQYVSKMHQLLAPNGRLVGVLFNKIFDHTTHPPFGGTPAEYETLFAPYFNFHTFAACYNSIKPRENTEWFVNFVRK